MERSGIAFRLAFFKTAPRSLAPDGQASYWEAKEDQTIYQIVAWPVEVIEQVELGISERELNGSVFLLFISLH
ncbi:hypothetical protein GCM10027423_63990 [Spirosoma arcticum]